MIKLLVLVSVLSVAYSHTCLVFPVQRGGLNNSMSTAGADACGKIASPCGGMAKRNNEHPITFYSGRNYSIVFQKNLDHFYSNNTGYFELNIEERNMFLKSLAVLPDTYEYRTLDFITTNVVMPEKGDMLQLIYHTNNPEAPPNFYQCADIEILPGP